MAKLKQIQMLRKALADKVEKQSNGTIKLSKPGMYLERFLALVSDDEIKGDIDAAELLATKLQPLDKKSPEVFLNQQDRRQILAYASFLGVYQSLGDKGAISDKELLKRFFSKVLSEIMTSAQRKLQGQSDPLEAHSWSSLLIVFDQIVAACKKQQSYSAYVDTIQDSFGKTRIERKKEKDSISPPPAAKVSTPTAPASEKKESPKTSTSTLTTAQQPTPAAAPKPTPTAAPKTPSKGEDIMTASRCDNGKPCTVNEHGGLCCPSHGAEYMKHNDVVNSAGLDVIQTMYLSNKIIEGLQKPEKNPVLEQNKFQALGKIQNEMNRIAQQYKPNQSKFAFLIRVGAVSSVPSGTPDNAGETIAVIMDQMFQKRKSDSVADRQTFVFQLSGIGGDHTIGFVCNTDGECALFNGLGRGTDANAKKYSAQNQAIIDAFTTVFKKAYPGTPVPEAGKFTASVDQQYEQVNNTCVVDIAMMLASVSNKPLKEQELGDRYSQVLVSSRDNSKEVGKRKVFVKGTTEMLAKNDLNAVTPSLKAAVAVKPSTTASTSATPPSSAAKKPEAPTAPSTTASPLSSAAEVKKPVSSSASTKPVAAEVPRPAEAPAASTSATPSPVPSAKPVEVAQPKPAKASSPKLAEAKAPAPASSSTPASTSASSPSSSPSSSTSSSPSSSTSSSTSSSAAKKPVITISASPSPAPSSVPPSSSSAASTASSSPLPGSSLAGPVVSPVPPSVSPSSTSAAAAASPSSKPAVASSPLPSPPSVASPSVGMTFTGSVVSSSSPAPASAPVPAVPPAPAIFPLNHQLAANALHDVRARFQALQETGQNAFERAEKAIKKAIASPEDDGYGYKLTPNEEAQKAEFVKNHDKLSQAVKRVQDGLDDSLVKIDDLQDKLDKANNNLDEAKRNQTNELSHINANINRLTAELANHQNTYSDLMAQLTECKVKIERVEREIPQKQAEKGELSRRVTQLKRAQQALGDKVRRLQASQMRLKKPYEEAKAELEKIKRKKEEFTQQATAMDQKVQQCQDAYNSAVAKGGKIPSASGKVVIANAKADWDKALIEKSALLNRIVASDFDDDTFDLKVKEQQKEVDKYKQPYDEANAEFMGASADLDALSKQRLAANNSLIQVKNKIEELEEDQDYLEARENEIIDSLQYEDHQITAISIDLNKANLSLAKAELQLTEAVATATAEVVHAQESLLTETNNLTQAYNDAITRNADLAKQVAKDGANYEEFADNLADAPKIAASLAAKAQKLEEALKAHDRANDAYLTSSRREDLKRVVATLKHFAVEPHQERMEAALRQLRNKLTDSDYFDVERVPANADVKLAYENCVKALEVIVDNKKVEAFFGAGAVYHPFAPDAQNDKTKSDAMKDAARRVLPGAADDVVGEIAEADSKGKGNLVKSIKDGKGYIQFESATVGVQMPDRNVNQPDAPTTNVNYFAVQDDQNKVHIKTYQKPEIPRLVKREDGLLEKEKPLKQFTIKGGRTVELYTSAIDYAHEQLCALTNGFKDKSKVININKIPNQECYDAMYYVAQAYGISLGRRPANIEGLGAPQKDSIFKRTPDPEKEVKKYILEQASAEAGYSYGIAHPARITDPKAAADRKERFVNEGAMKDLIAGLPQMKSGPDKELFSFENDAGRKIVLYENAVKYAYETLQDIFPPASVNTDDTGRERKINLTAEVWAKIIKTQAQYDAFVYVGRHLGLLKPEDHAMFRDNLAALSGPHDNLYKPAGKAKDAFLEISKPYVHISEFIDKLEEQKNDNGKWNRWRNP